MNATRSICLSIVSHGQQDVALALLHDLARLRPPAVSRIVYTANIAEPPLPPLDLGSIALERIDNPVPKGFGANHNAAFRACREGWFAVLNPDLRFPTDPFPALLAAASTDDRLALLAPLITDSDGQVQNTARRLYTPTEMVQQKRHPANVGRDAHWLAGMFLLVRSDAYAGIGGFDERYFLYIEDVDFCSRLVVAGWTLRQVAEATAIHDARKQSHRSLRFTLWHLQGMLRYWTGRSYRDHRRLLKGSSTRPD